MQFNLQRDFLSVLHHLFLIPHSERFGSEVWSRVEAAVHAIVIGGGESEVPGLFYEDIGYMAARNKEIELLEEELQLYRGKPRAERRQSEEAMSKSLMESAAVAAANARISELENELQAANLKADQVRVVEEQNATLVADIEAVEEEVSCPPAAVTTL